MGAYVPPSGTHWRDDGWPMGHASYCVDPSHSTLRWCSASASEPGTLRGGDSRAFARDHQPVLLCAAGVKACNECRWFGDRDHPGDDEVYARAERASRVRA